MRRAAAALLAVLLAFGGLARIAATEIVGHAETRASDALPLYLSAAAVAAGDDPTQEASLAEAYDARGLSVGAATFSTLYPATAGAVLRPLATLDWPAFTTAWRWLLLASVAAIGAAAGLRVPGDRARRLGWAGAVTAALAWHPVTAECVRLGQVNLLLGALCALGLAAVDRPGNPRGSALAGVLLGIGGALKLVPAALLLPAAAARRWRPVAVAALVGGAALALALPVTPPLRFVEAVRGTLHFQSSIDPDWLVGRDPAPEWMRVLGWIRHAPLQWITLGLAGLVPALRPSARTAASGMALLCAWLGADAAGFHVLYAPLAYPVLVLLAGRRAPWLGLVGGFALLAAWPAALAPEPRMVLFGLLAWAMAAGALLVAAAGVPAGRLEQDAEARQAGLAAAGVATGLLLVGALPGEGPVAAPLPEGQHTPEGPGFIHASDRVPGAIRALGGGLDRPASTLARPGTIRGLQLYLRAAPVRWRALAEQYPARADLLEERARAVPSGDLRDHSGRAIGAWLRDEASMVSVLRSEGLELGDLPAGLDAALASGLTDPRLEETTAE